MKDIDRLFNVGNTLDPEEYEGVNHAQFKDEVNQLIAKNQVRLNDIKESQSARVTDKNRRTGSDNPV